MIPKIFRSAFILALFLIQSNAAVGERQEGNSRDFAGGTGWGSTRDEIMENRKRRKRQLGNMVNAMRKKLADHSAGEITLDPQEKADTERRLDLYSRKLDTLNHDLDDEVRRRSYRFANLQSML